MNEEAKRRELETSAEVEAPVDETGSELASYIDRLQRLQAEFENYKKRTARDIGMSEQRAIDQVLIDFITPYENLERAFRSYAADENVEPFVKGVEQIFAQFAQILERYAVERIPAAGVSFDPALHEALLTVPSGQKKNTIIEEFSPGYRRDGRVLRPSQVTVSEGPAAQEEQT